ncbi:MAG TPA: radical SAM protein [Bacilli bacterium]|nr:radical SAM protein [Bacilli bacterium]HPZ27628.1 radical SAM protein [Bacilli bacterium]HQC89899.1 radical SAM protein [Bacilli bacterium]
MKEHKFVYGPIPSRRLGRSLGIAPIPAKTCSFSCVYCQLGRTKRITTEREMFFPVEEILSELKDVSVSVEYDIVSIVGDGEPTLYAGLGQLIKGAKEITGKPVCVITNGSLLFDPAVRKDLSAADIVSPSLDAYDEESFRKINRSSRNLDFSRVFSGIIDFSREYKGELWLEIMLVSGINDDDESLYKLRECLREIRYDRLYINVPLRPPAETWVKPSAAERLEKAGEILGGVSIQAFSDQDFQSGIEDDYQAIISVIGRHAMRAGEIERFLENRGNDNASDIFARLDGDPEVEKIHYQNIVIYRKK